MNKKIKKLWLQALRSGEYKQETGVLCRTMDGGGVGFCCLGVLTDLYYKKENKGEWKTREGVQSLPAPVAFEENGDRQSAVTPKSVMLWAGLVDENPDVVVNGNHTNLAELNDGGKSFKQIANIIEKHL